MVTGSNGFIGKSLIVHLKEQQNFSVLTFLERTLTQNFMRSLNNRMQSYIWLENRPKEILDFETVNLGLTHLLCCAIRNKERKVPLVLASSIQADQENPYGMSKLAAERAVKELAYETGNPVYMLSVANVFGKWCKPNYNSVVATFYYNIANDIHKINDASTKLKLVYVDDVVKEFIHVVQQKKKGVYTPKIEPEFSITLGELAKQLKDFRNCRSSLILEKVGIGLGRALCSTFMGYLSPEQFSYPLSSYGDERGMFVEMLKTKDSGQFRSLPLLDVTRGGHYHHKTEKFLS